MEGYENYWRPHFAQYYSEGDYKERRKGNIYPKKEGVESTEIIKRRLCDNFILAGLTERIDDFVFLLCRMMGWNNGYIDRVYVSHRPPVREDLTPEQVERTMRLLGEEYKLYHHVESLFQEKWERLGMIERVCAGSHQYAAKTLRVCRGLGRSLCSIARM